MHASVYSVQCIYIIIICHTLWSVAFALFVHKLQPTCIWFENSKTSFIYTCTTYMFTWYPKQCPSLNRERLPPPTQIIVPRGARQPALILYCFGWITWEQTPFLLSLRHAKMGPIHPKSALAADLLWTVPVLLLLEHLLLRLMMHLSIIVIHPLEMEMILLVMVTI